MRTETEDKTQAAVNRLQSVIAGDFIEDVYQVSRFSPLEQRMGVHESWTSDLVTLADAYLAHLDRQNGG